jgi:outer membrane lipoprotein-sorting protein/outer membrane protein assembly factor BamB
MKSAFETRRSGTVMAWLLFAAGLICSTGCFGSSSDTKATAANDPPQPEKRSVEQVLQNMEAAYRGAANYSDNAQVHRRFEKDKQTFEQLYEFSTAFQRPNMLRLECYGARVVCDGANFWASVDGVPDLVLKIPAPEKLTVEDVIRDPQLYSTLVQGPGGAPVQIGLLLTDGTIQQFLQDAMQPPKLIAPEVMDGHPCNRIQVDKQDGNVTLWIDQQDNILRRIELPTVAQAQLPGIDAPVSNVTTTIDFTNASFQAPGGEAFKFAVPDNAKLTTQLVEEVQPTAPAKASDPTNLKLTKLWSAADVKDPGNILMINGADGQPRIFAFDGWRTVVELDKDGKTLARHELDIPKDGVVNYLRTAVDKDGHRYFVAAANAQPQLFVFDENWKRLLNFPKPEENSTQGVWDAQIADLKGDGKPQLYIGYWGDLGVQAADLTGNRLWRDRSVQFVFRLATTEPDEKGRRHLLCTHNRGSIMMFDADGKMEKEINFPNRNVYYVVGDDIDGSGKNSYCSLVGTTNGDNIALGVSLDGKELWNYTLPVGVHARPIEVIGTGDLTGDAGKQWIIAGPDGSIHILGADGKPVDKFSTGSTLAGMTSSKLGDQRVLLISKVFDKPQGDVKGTLEAWQVEPVVK